MGVADLSGTERNRNRRSGRSVENRVTGRFQGRLAFEADVEPVPQPHRAAAGEDAVGVGRADSRNPEQLLPVRRVQPNREKFRMAFRPALLRVRRQVEVAVRLEFQL